MRRVCTQVTAASYDGPAITSRQHPRLVGSTHRLPSSSQTISKCSAIGIGSGTCIVYAPGTFTHDDQAKAVAQLLCSDRRIRVLIGPAGAGKTRALRAVVDAWQHSGGDVLGLTVSQSAARVLAEEAQVRAENTAKWLHETRRGHW